MSKIVYVLIWFQFLGSTMLCAQLIDKKATSKTERLYHYLGQPRKGFLFGHQDALVSGVDGLTVTYDSDIRRSINSHPAVIGWDLGMIERSLNIDSIYFKNILKGIKKAYRMGAINTISWHTANPQTGGDSWDKTGSLKDVLPGGKDHQQYIRQLDLLAKFIKQCRVGIFSKIPIIFRPFHEQNGDWFWWGKSNGTEEEYVELWRFTIDFLKNEKKINQLIYAYSPDRSRFDPNDMHTSYMYGYPGDDYIDIIGLDNYWDLGHQYNRDSQQVRDLRFIRSLQLIQDIAKEKGKVAALTETGNLNLKYDNWFTDKLLRPIDNAGIDNISWVLIWRNRNRNNLYVPHETHKQFKDFKKFIDSEHTLLLTDIENPYKKKR